jgi:hypothetical protein
MPQAVCGRDCALIWIRKRASARNLSFRYNNWRRILGFFLPFFPFISAELQQSRYREFEGGLSIYKQEA